MNPRSCQLAHGSSHTCEDSPPRAVERLVDSAAMPRFVDGTLQAFGSRESQEGLGSRPLRRRGRAAVDVLLTSEDGETVTIDLSLDQTRKLVIELTTAYGACRPALLDQK
jgi:hypothetical protein